MDRLIDAKCRILYTMQSGQIKYKESTIYETIDNDIKQEISKGLSAVWTGEIPHKTVQGQADKGYGK